MGPPSGRGHRHGGDSVSPEDQGTECDPRVAIVCGRIGTKKGHTHSPLDPHPTPDWQNRHSENKPYTLPPVTPPHPVRQNWHSENKPHTPTGTTSTEVLWGGVAVLLLHRDKCRQSDAP